MTSQDKGSEIKDRVQIGLSADGKAVLREMEKQEIIPAMLDGYRLAIAMAISRGLEPSTESSADRENMYNMATLDPDGEIKLLIREIFPQASEWPNRAAESLAEQGIPLIKEHAEGGKYWLGTMCPAEPSGNGADAPGDDADQ